ncbi:MAG: FAD-dependent oxidoreductase [Deltaproteobacteria bacterium]|nr:FAD-dependent oxidoreductase [Deltaproteobacteria bacterium]
MSVSSPSGRPRVAIIGAGISGLGCAWRLQDRCEVTIYEKDARLGGHAHTVDAGAARVDTGFIVFNERTYPRFTRLLKELGVPSRPTTMGLSVRDDAAGLEYCRETLRTVFSQLRNLVRPSFWRMLRESLRFNRLAARIAQATSSEGESLSQFLAREGFSETFARHYLHPLVASIWSADRAAVDEMPIEFVARFFENHGFLKFRKQPPWRVVEGGSSTYVRALASRLKATILPGCAVQSVRRLANCIEVRTERGSVEHHDFVVFATHSDETLAMLSDPSPEERSILGAIRYGNNTVTLHTDTSVLPRNRLAWASWNYWLAADRPEGLITYHMNTVQEFDSEVEYLVSLNAQSSGVFFAPSKILCTIEYRHPIFDAAARAAQKERMEIFGRRRTYYCGAYWSNGFHEDGLRSAEEASEALLKELDHEHDDRLPGHTAPDPVVRPLQKFRASQVG